MKNFWLHVLGSLIGIAIVFVPLDCQRKQQIQEIESNVEWAHKRMNSLFYEFSDSCTWIDVNRETLIKIGLPVNRRSDNEPVEVLHLYGCMNFKE